MSEISNADIYNVIINMRGDLSRLESKVDGHHDLLAAHIIEDKIVTESVRELQITQAKQRGFVAAISAVGSVFGVGLGWVVTAIIRGNHS